MKLSAAIDKRRSIRRYSDKKVRWDKVLEAIDAAIKAPFAGNMNNLKFVIVEEQEAMNRLAECCQQDWVADASFVVVVCSDYRKLEQIYHEHAKTYALQHAGAAIENFLLKITDLKLASCWIGAFDETHVKRKLGIPNDMRVEAILPVGYASPTLKIKAPRKDSLEKSIYWGKWDTKKRPGIPRKDPRTW